MLAIILLVFTLTISMVITRVGTLALVLTGMSRDAARFQARSAFYGVGFTTSESENVVNHPVRRKIIALLMVVGNVGITTMIATIIVSLLSTSNSGEWSRNLLILLAGLMMLWAVASSTWLARVMSRLMRAALRRWTSLDVRDYVALLHLASGYSVLEMTVQADDWLSHRTLQEANLSHHGILVLGIRRSGSDFVGAPTGRTAIEPQDVLIVYGQMETLMALDRGELAPPGEDVGDAFHEHTLRAVG